MSAILTLAELEHRVKVLGVGIGATPNDLPTFGYSRDGGYPHVEVDAHHYHYITVERGQELTHIITDDLDELLWHVFQNVAATLATKFELKHRIAGQDFRRLMFAKRIELLGALSPVWAERERAYVEALLLKHPYDASKY
ncbi:MAG: Imm63 family immunity protein [Gemmatimonadaceae bacterium]